MVIKFSFLNYKCHGFVGMYHGISMMLFNIPWCTMQIPLYLIIIMIIYAGSLYYGNSAAHLVRAVTMLVKLWSPVQAFSLFRCHSSLLSFWLQVFTLQLVWRDLFHYLRFPVSLLLSVCKNHFLLVIFRRASPHSQTQSPILCFSDYWQ